MQIFRRWWPLLLLCAGLTRVAGGSGTQQPRGEIEKVHRLIEQLGDEDYFLRQRAQQELGKFSIEAFDALYTATSHKDLEIAARAKYLLSRMPIAWTTDGDPPEVRRLLRDYEALDPSAKLIKIRELALLEDGQGIAPLCRLIRYERSPALSRRAAIMLIDLKPHGEPPEKKLADSLRAGLEGSCRTGAAWVLTWLQFADDSQTAANAWSKLVEEEYSRLRDAQGTTASDIVSRLVRLEAECLRNLGRHEQSLTALRRLIDLESGNPDTLAELLDWLIENKAWKVADELAARFVDQFSKRPMLLYNLARALDEQGDHQRAEQTAQRALKLNPGADSRQLAQHYDVARKLRVAGMSQWARREYELVLDTGSAANPVVRTALVDLLDWLVELKQWPEIGRLATRFESLFEETAVLLYTLAQSQAERGDRREAEKTAERAFQLDPGKNSTELGKHATAARTLQERKLFDWARREFQYLVEHQPQRSRSKSLVGLLDCLVAQQAWKSVRELAESFDADFSKSASLLYALAQAQAEEGNLELAEATAARALNLQSDSTIEHINAHYMAALTLRDRGRFDWAEREFRYVIDKIERVSPTVQNILAEMLHDQQKELEAAKVFEDMFKSLQQQPPGPLHVSPEGLSALRARMNYFFACHFENNNDGVKQREHLQKAIKADPTDADVLIALYRLPGRTAEQREKVRGLIRRAAAQFRREIEDEPGSPTGYNQFAWLIGNTEGDLDEALKFSQKSLQLRPDSGGYLDTLAHVYFGKGDYENAFKTQTRAVEQDPHSGVIRRKLEVFRAKWEEEQPSDSP